MEGLTDSLSELFYQYCLKLSQIILLLSDAEKFHSLEIRFHEMSRIKDAEESARSVCF